MNCTPHDCNLVPQKLPRTNKLSAMGQTCSYYMPITKLKPSGLSVVYKTGGNLQSLLRSHWCTPGEPGYVSDFSEDDMHKCKC